MLKIKDKRLRIGIVCYPSIGGSGVIATNLGNELARRGHNVHFISYDKPFRLAKHKNIRFHKVNINKYSLFKYPDYTLPLAVEIGNVHEKYALDVVHVHYAVPHATAALLAVQMIEECEPSCKPPRVITTLHGTDITLLAQDPSLYEIIKFSIEKSGGVTAVSNYLKKQTQKVLKTKKSIKVIYNFYTPARVTHSREWVRRSLGINNNDFLAIHLSNLRPVKRIPDLLKVAAELKHNKHFKLLILAGGDFAPYEPLLKKLNLQKTVIVKKGEANVENYLNAADIGLYTSEEESFGLGILESMAFGQPIVATNIGGIPEVVKDGKTGFLAKLGDVKALARHVIKLMKDNNLRQKMGNAAKLRAQTKFNTQKIVEQYLHCYQRSS